MKGGNCCRYESALSSDCEDTICDKNQRVYKHNNPRYICRRRINRDFVVNFFFKIHLLKHFDEINDGIRINMCEQNLHIVSDFLENNIVTRMIGDLKAINLNALRKVYRFSYSNVYFLYNFIFSRLTRVYNVIFFAIESNNLHVNPPFLIQSVTDIGFGANPVANPNPVVANPNPVVELEEGEVPEGGKRKTRKKRKTTKRKNKKVKRKTKRS